MEKMTEHQLKVVLNNGHVIGFYCDDYVLEDLIYHPKFIKVHDSKNDIFVSLDDISAFEIMGKPQGKHEFLEGNERKPGFLEKE